MVRLQARARGWLVRQKLHKQQKAIISIQVSLYNLYAHHLITGKQTVTCDNDVWMCVKRKMNGIFVLLLIGLVANGESQADVCHVLQCSETVGALHHQAAASR